MCRWKDVNVQVYMNWGATLKLDSIQVNPEAWCVFHVKPELGDQSNA